MPVRINNIILDINEDISMVKERASKKSRVPVKDMKEFKILRESVDARKKDAIKFNYTVEFSCNNEDKIVKRARNKDIRLEKSVEKKELLYGNKTLNHRPIIVGMGPAGLFAGLILAKNGYDPIIIERGEDVDSRTSSVNNFWNTGKLNLNSNVQFGEGGAGTFSDGKLTTRIKDSWCDFILKEFVEKGASEEIIYSGKPHIGTDVLKTVVKNIRKQIIELGGEVHFNSKLEDIIIKDNKLKAIIVNGDEIPCEVLILSIGHSARDTYEMLFKRGISVESKAFAMGVRVEHSQALINERQYGKFAGHPRLKAADYRIVHNGKDNRGIYSFCMCPGGYVVAAASEEGRVVTNGMSYHDRSGKNANSAIVVSVTPKDFSSNNPLSGMELQRHYEGLAYKLGGENYYAPIQLVEDFIRGERTVKLGNVEPTYKPGYKLEDLRKCLPSIVVDGLVEGIYNFDNKIKGFISSGSVLTGIETRTSAPIRILRNKELQSISTKGLYPTGEGAGYAGGIMSAAVDGLKVGEKIIEEFKPLKI